MWYDFLSKYAPVFTFNNNMRAANSKISILSSSNKQVPVFISEITPKQLRGALATANQVQCSHKIGYTILSVVLWKQGTITWQIYLWHGFDIYTYVISCLIKLLI